MKPIDHIFISNGHLELFELSTKAMITPPITEEPIGDSNLVLDMRKIRIYYQHISVTMSELIKMLDESLIDDSIYGLDMISEIEFHDTPPFSILSYIIDEDEEFLELWVKPEFDKGSFFGTDFV